MKRVTTSTQILVIFVKFDTDLYILIEFASLISSVDGYKQKNAYISTQGPLPKTASDFWQMVWDQHSLVIVMTTKTMERGRVKCFQYWHSTPDESCVYGNFQARTTAVETNEDYTVTSIEIKNIKVSLIYLFFSGL